MNYHKLTLNKKETGRKIRFLIVKSKLTYYEISSMLELSSPRVIYSWSSGKKMPSIENLANLAKIFNVEIESIIVMR